MASTHVQAMFVVFQRLGVEFVREGHLYKACCPFHNEAHPSFKFDPEHGFAKCYSGCGDLGYWSDALHLILAHLFGPNTRYSKEEYKAAHRLLEQWGIDEPDNGLPFTPRIFIPRVPTDEVRAVVAEAFHWSQDQLQKDPVALRYWRGRGMGPSEDRYAGFFPRTAVKQYQLLQHLRTRKMLPEAQQAGVLDRANSIRLVNRFMLYIPDAQGLPQYWQARWLPTNTPKDREIAKYLSPFEWTPPVVWLDAGSWAVHVVEGMMKGLACRAEGATTLVSFGEGNVHRAAMELRDAVAQGRPIYGWHDMENPRSRAVFVDDLAKVIGEYHQREYERLYRVRANPYEDSDDWRVHDRSGFHQFMQARIAA